MTASVPDPSQESGTLPRDQSVTEEMIGGDWKRGVDYAVARQGTLVAERDAALAEVTRLREALVEVRINRARTDYVANIVNAALAEGSDVLPSQRGH